MKRWNGDEHAENPKIDAFLEEVRAVCKRHGFAISHEDAHGGFEILPIADGDLEWLMQATDRTGKK